MTKIMPVLDLTCGERTCITRSERNGLRPCEWYRQKGAEEHHARCLLFGIDTLRKRLIGRYAFGIRCEECRTAGRVFSQVQENVTNIVTQIHETMRDGLVSLVEAQENLGKVAATRGG